MYLFFGFGLACAIGHHVYYTRLDGKPAADQLQMLRYGMALSFAAKAGLSAAVLVAFHQRIWMTVRTRLLSVAAVDALFSVTEDLAAFLSWEMVKNAKVAAGLALFIWLAPLMVILTGNTLLVEPATTTTQDACPGVRSLNFTFEETYDWRRPSSVDGLLEIPLSLWNTTKPPDSDPPGWFDYYTAPHPILEQTATIGAFLQQTVVRKNAQVETCGSGWNCSFEISFVAPGYKCTELASGVGSRVKDLIQESGPISPPFDTDVLIPVGFHSYYAFATGGDYSSTQMEDVGIGGIPKTPPPYPRNFGALRTEPVLWVGYAELVDPSKPAPLPTSPDWKTSFVPKIFACENYEASYTVRFNYTDGTLLTNTTSLSFLSPVINTTYRPHVDASDGTADNVTAIPAGNYVLPIDTAHYRRTAAYHSLSLLVRTMVNGTINIDKTIANPVVNTGAIQTKLIDPENRYFPRPQLQTRMQRFYEDIILSMLSRTQFTPVVWAARPAEQSGTALQTGEEYRYPCTKSRTANVYKYQVRDLWIVYGIAILLSFVGVVAGQLAIGDDPADVRDAAWSSIVAATRGSALDRVNWDGRPDGPAGNPMAMKVGYGVVETPTGSDAAMSTGWDGGKPLTYGFGLEGQVRQR
ncbi:hypothetical protein B0T18DRAFT_335140 [Schizothecium vesticola]|uniref:Uncharacterized protein n=1 Tax=Schizothecium vesticola TaxID=314040 RepID=A0AA40BRL8_9PEZI|nr:hypothetical protein B0T18DRAFT_335140 [Schizothecium vesticola]